MENPEIDHVDEERLNAFLEWMNDAHFTPTKFSGLENVKKDRELRQKVMSFLENIYEEGYNYSVWRSKEDFNLLGLDGQGKIIILSGQPRIATGPAIQPGSIKKITDKDTINPNGNTEKDLGINILQAEATVQCHILSSCETPKSCSNASSTDSILFPQILSATIPSIAVPNSRLKLASCTIF
ncbi:hypothetical protein ACJ73_08169 [Blastomyces percursus]|uniref:Uncharacterized protein n=1 Tax=Blastomyces percursus TaxID=1658174 RepID=A0A1J9PW28_9EURO|nr:hypothetical protein ACJ73_08169 [Blastomyces percursus]